MKGLKTLTLMQLKDKVDLSFTKSLKQTIFKIVLSLLKFAIVTALIYFLFYVLNSLRLVSFLPGIPQEFLTVVFTIMFLLSIITCTFGLMKSLYFSKDNALLLTMPTDRLAVFISKLVVYYIYELIRNLTYLLPLFLAYGLINSLPIYFYLWLIVIIPVFSALSVSLGALLSIIAMLGNRLVKNFKWLEFILLALAVGAIVVFIVSAINKIPQNIDIVGSWGTTFWKIQNFMTNFINIFLPFSWLINAAVGSRIGVSNKMFSASQLLSFGGLVLTIIVILALAFLIVRPIFFKMVSSPFEYKKDDKTKIIKNKRRKSFISLIKKNALIYYRTPEKFYNLLFVVFALPIAIFLLNKIYFAMDTRLTGAYMTITFNILVILLFALSSNVALSHAYSEEGASSYLMKTLPKPYLEVVAPKLIINFIALSLSLLAAVIIFSSFATITTFQTILIYLSLLAIYSSHLLWAAETDIMNSQTLQYQTTGGHISNPNETKTTITAILLSAFFAFVVFFLIPENQNIVWYKLLLISFGFLAGRIWLFVNKVNVYFKERE